jgi:BASS family bile acid:Na+ symporter
MKDTEIASVGIAGGRVSVTIPKLLLSLLLFNAGVRVSIARVRRVARRPGVMLVGLAANLVVPLVFLALILPALQNWHNPDEAALVLVGLALVTAMPIAGSSAGWAQSADGDMALSLGLVLGSTLLSPLTTPASLRALGAFAPGQCGEELRRIAAGDMGAFLSAWVLIPSLLGILVRSLLSESQAAMFERRLKLIAPLSLLVLCYANASPCLPIALGQPDWDFLGIIVTLVIGLCVVTFTSGYVLGRLLGADRGQQASLIFGLGMNNNGTGLVVASVAVHTQPMVMLPIIVHNLMQHLVAGSVDALLKRAEGD